MVIDTRRARRGSECVSVACGMIYLMDGWMVGWLGGLWAVFLLNFLIHGASGVHKSVLLH